MIRITIPGNNYPEREYTLNTIFSDFLGIDYEIIVTDHTQDYSISINDNELIIRDAFFAHYPVAHSYLNDAALPEKISWAKNDFILEKDIPIIFGSEELLVSDNKIICGIDIFASVFFMRSRWEEFVNRTKDEHDNFPASAGIAYKNAFLDRPVVNEYVEMLWALIQKLGYKGERKTGNAEIILTHDIDHLDYPKTYRILLGDILKRRQLNQACKHLKQYIKTKKNPYDSFDFIMTCSEKLNLKSHFYFMASNTNKLWDKPFYLTSDRFRDKIKEIKIRGHIIGFHPGYYSVNNEEIWQSEKTRLEQAVEQEINEGRQHYLRFKMPYTFRIWESNNMEFDSTLGDNLYQGYRCGTGNSYTVFDFLERKRLKVKERPLIIMDGNLSSYSSENAIEVVRKYITITKRYKSTLTLLFHNSTFYGENWKGYDLIYLRSLGL